jgi:tetratricopeptide (TPR) repeat protein
MSPRFEDRRTENEGRSDRGPERGGAPRDRQDRPSAGRPGFGGDRPAGMGRPSTAGRPPSARPGGGGAPRKLERNDVSWGERPNRGRSAPAPRTWGSDSASTGDRYDNRENRDARPARSFGDRPAPREDRYGRGDRPAGDDRSRGPGGFGSRRPGGDARPQGRSGGGFSGGSDRPRPYGDSGDRGGRPSGPTRGYGAPARAYGERPYGARQAPTDRPSTDRPYSDRPYSDRPGASRPPSGRSDRPYGDQPRGDRPSYGARSGGDRPYGDRGGSDRPGGRFGLGAPRSENSERPERFEQTDRAPRTDRADRPGSASSAWRAATGTTGSGDRSWGVSNDRGSSRPNRDAPTARGGRDGGRDAARGSGRTTGRSVGPSGAYGRDEPEARPNAPYRADRVARKDRDAARQNLEPGERLLPEQEFVPASQKRSKSGTPGKPWEAVGWERSEEASIADEASGAVRRSMGDDEMVRPEETRKRTRTAPATVAKEIKDAVGNRRGARVESALMEASVAFERERYSDALKLLRPLLEEAPDMAALQELIGLCLYRQEKWLDALRHLDRFVELNGSVEQHPVMADCHRALRHYGQVKALWEELSASSPSADLVAEGRIVMAGSLADQGSLGEAIALMERAPLSTKRPKGHHLRMWYVLADLYERAGDVPRARELFGRISGFEPEFVDVGSRISALG